MDLVTFGEAMVVLTPEDNSSLNMASSFKKYVGGAEANVAIALSRLNHKVGWFSRMSKDSFSKYVISSLRGEGVDLSHIVFDEEKNTGLLFKDRYLQSDPTVIYYRKNSAASCLNENDVSEEYIKNSKILHITGITPALSECCNKAVFKAIEYAVKNGVKISFDPNIRLKLWTIEKCRDTLLKIIPFSNYIFIGRDEGEILLGDKDEKILGEKLLNMGAEVVVIKLGEKGSYVITKDKSFYSEGFKVNKVIDTAGAGDGFAAGFLSGILNGETLESCAVKGNALGALAITSVGDSDGYPDCDQLNKFLGNIPSINR